MKVHPAAKLFPMLPEQELKELAASIKAHGLMEPIVVHRGVLLDGRNRLAACKLAGVEPAVVQYSGDQPIEFIIGRNLTRRHLSDSQRAMVAAKLAKLPHGGDRRSDQGATLRLETPTQSEAAKLLRVSRRSVQKARAVDVASPELAEEVASGKLSLNAASKKAAKSKPRVTLSPASMAAHRVCQNLEVAVGDYIRPKLREVFERAFLQHLESPEYDGEMEEADARRKAAKWARDTEGTIANDAMDWLDDKVREYDASTDAEKALRDPDEEEDDK